MLKITNIHFEDTVKHITNDVLTVLNNLPNDIKNYDDAKSEMDYPKANAIADTVNLAIEVLSDLKLIVYPAFDFTLPEKLSKVLI